MDTPYPIALSIAFVVAFLVGQVDGRCLTFGVCFRLFPLLDTLAPGVEVASSFAIPKIALAFVAMPWVLATDPGWPNEGLALAVEKTLKNRVVVFHVAFVDVVGVVGLVGVVGVAALDGQYPWGSAPVFCFALAAAAAADHG